MSLGLGKVVFVFLAFLGSTRGGDSVGAAKKAKGRNQTIRNKFFAQKENIKDTHPHIVDWFDSTSDRSLQTEIIEKRFEKQGKLWKIDLDKPFFKESRTRCVNLGTLEL